MSLQCYLVRGIKVLDGFRWFSAVVAEESAAEAERMLRSLHVLGDDADKWFLDTGLIEGVESTNGAGVCVIKFS